MKVIALIVLQVIRLQLARCQGGGPSTFGYDASSACSKPYSRAGRARLTNLPCDFRRQNWCTIAGSSYPWHAVRRFVQENQGLMRRMYGDERHINVLRAELERNDVELKYDDHYHRFSEDRRRFQYDDDYEFIDDDRDDARASGDEYGGRGFTSRSFNDPTTRRLNKFPKLSEYTRPHFRPTEGSGEPANGATIASTTAASPATTVKSTANATSPSSTSSTVSSPTSVDTNLPASTVTGSTVTTDAARRPEAATGNTTDELDPLPTITASQVDREQNFSINEIPGQIDRVDENVEELVEPQQASDATIDEGTTVETFAVTETPVEVVEEVANDDADDGDDVLDSGKETTVHETFASAQQEFRPRPEYHKPSQPEASGVEGGQLYQDAAANDQQEQPVLKLRGVNACPVKEEVVAPFWANNTRGEVLALLNLYPFEQYVHWEKCTHENKQMYCRDGCRCEQQYRLHRLLAYDPSNECRGIFSDWFKFPSCCVCRCYDLPLEFRVTSRSPRTQRQRIKVQPPRGRHA